MLNANVKQYERAAVTKMQIYFGRYLLDSLSDIGIIDNAYGKTMSI